MSAWRDFPCRGSGPAVADDPGAPIFDAGAREIGQDREIRLAGFDGPIRTPTETSVTSTEIDPGREPLKVTNRDFMGHEIIVK
jgi:hypothetical protein